MAILEREVHKLRSGDNLSMKVQWKNCPIEETTWEIELDMLSIYL